MRRPLPVEQLAAPLVLRVAGVFDLEPSDVQVHSGRDAPKLAVRATGIEPVGLTGSLSFVARETSAARDPNRRACIAERAGPYYCGPTDTKEMSAIEDRGRFTMRLSRSLQLASLPTRRATSVLGNRSRLSYSARRGVKVHVPQRQPLVGAAIIFGSWAFRCARCFTPAWGFRSP